MNMIIHDMEGDIVIGDTLRNPKLLKASSLRKFDLVVANPMWNQDGYDEKFYESDALDRFEHGYPSASSADWGWVQHIFASLNDKGKAAIVLDTGAVSRGSGNHGSNKERDIRQEFVNKDWIEAALLLPENLFCNTPGPGIILILNKSKPKEHKGKILLINASLEFDRGKPKNFILDSKIRKIVEAFHGWRNIDKFARIISTEDVTKNDYNLHPARYVGDNTVSGYAEIEELLVELAELDEERVNVDREVNKITWVHA